MTSRQDWEGQLGAEWARQTAALDRLLGPSTDIALARFAAAPGERVLDVGCGAGRSTVALARMAGRVTGSGGRVTGIDVSRDLLAAAAARLAEAGIGNAEFVAGDAGEPHFADGIFDGMFSAFGTMFFDDPITALATLRRAIRPGGRAVMLAWREAAANPWSDIALAAGREVLGPAAPPPPGAPGPFAWASPGQFEPLLAQAGFREILWHETPTRPEIALGDDPDPVTRAVAFMTGVGPLSRRLREVGEAGREAVAGRLHARLLAHSEGGALHLDASAWVIEARA